MTDTKHTLSSLDIQGILGVLPHRFPFLLVDRIVEIAGEDSCIGLKNVSANEPQFAGHFPGQPIFPGVLILEGMAQTAGAIVLNNRPAGSPPCKVFFLTVDGAKFRRPVVPGDVLQLHMRKLTRKRTMWWYHGEARVDGSIVAEAKVGATIQDL